MAVDAWPDKYAAMLGLCGVVECRRPHLTSRIGLPRALAAACLLRCRRLLLAMDLQVSSGFNDTVGGQLRSLFELYVIGLWIILDPDEAYEDRSRDRRRSIGVMDKGAQMHLPDVEGWIKEKPGRDFRSVVERVGELLRARGNSGFTDFESNYHIVFRGESHRGAHGGLGAVLQHLHLIGEERVEVLERRSEADDGEASLLMGAAYLAHLADHVFGEFGINTDDVRALAGRLVPAAD